MTKGLYEEQVAKARGWRAVCNEDRAELVRAVFMLKGSGLITTYYY